MSCCVTGNKQQNVKALDMINVPLQSIRFETDLVNDENDLLESYS